MARKPMKLDAVDDYAKRRREAAGRTAEPKGTGGRPTTMPEPWAALARSAGSVDALLDRLAVSHMTLLRWSRGEPMRPSSVVLVRAVAGALEVASPV